jgi:tetratricopeptide (TPR) repeat protein
MTLKNFQEAHKNEVETLVEQGRLLLDLQRYADAEDNLRKALARDPQNPKGHSYLAVALLAQGDHKPEKLENGLREARRTITLHPDGVSGYFLLAWGQLLKRRPAEALDALQPGLRIDPQDEWGHSLMAQAYLMRSEWAKALATADEGLKFDPESARLLNWRAEALIMLDRKAEARAAIEMALRSDPSSARGHANQGWLALYDNNAPAALSHFREALRLDPNSETAREGLVRSLHARNPFYRVMLRYYLWAGRLTQSEFWGVVATLTGINATLRAAVRFFPPLALLVWPYLLLYSTFAFFTWITTPLFNLLLRLSPTGRTALSKDENASAFGCGFTGALVLVNLLGLVGTLILRPKEAGLIWGFVLGMGLSVAMMRPLAGVFLVPLRAKNRRALLITMAALLGSSAVCAWAGAFPLTFWHIIPLGLFALGWLLYPWVANVIIAWEG